MNIKELKAMLEVAEVFDPDIEFFIAEPDPDRGRDIYHPCEFKVKPLDVGTETYGIIVIKK